MIWLHKPLLVTKHFAKTDFVVPVYTHTHSHTHPRASEIVSLFLTNFQLVIYFYNPVKMHNVFLRERARTTNHPMGMRTKSVTRLSQLPTLLVAVGYSILHVCVRVTRRRRRRGNPPWKCVCIKEGVRVHVVQDAVVSYTCALRDSAQIVEPVSRHTQILH